MECNNFKFYVNFVDYIIFTCIVIQRTYVNNFHLFVISFLSTQCHQGDQMPNYKVAQFFPKVAQKVTTVLLFILAKKSPCIWATFDRNHVTKNFQNRPIWSHCLACNIRNISLQCCIHSDLVTCMQCDQEKIAKFL